MDGKTTNASNGASNNKRPVPTKQGKKEIGTKTNVDIADDLEKFTGEKGCVVAVNCGIAEFIHNTVKEAETAASSSSNSSTGNGKNSASKLGPIGKIDTGKLVIDLRNGDVATISAKDVKKEPKDIGTKNAKEHEGK